MGRLTDIGVSAVWLVAMTLTLGAIASVVYLALTAVLGAP